LHGARRVVPTGSRPRNHSRIPRMRLGGRTGSPSLRDAAFASPKIRIRIA
jgi:hypothetical protein